ncbi:DUF3575 domain-containing protein [Bacteroides sp.]|uniref:DUF3575 domain-containing protein n=1 Tax=Bacteroides sp. TaxID=29523 RepID=UPI003A955BFA
MNTTTGQHVFHLPENEHKRLFSGMPFLLLLFFIVCNTTDGRAQRVTVKTNMADWITASPNLSVEFTFSNRLSIDLSATGTPFKIKEDLYFRHLRLQPELRYWLTAPLTKHYVGVTAFYSTYDAGYKKRGYFGDSYAAGLTYGYNLILSRRWNFEVSAGLGAIRYRMARYTPGKTHPKPNETGWKIAPVKLGLSFAYILK